MGKLRLFVDIKGSSYSLPGVSPSGTSLVFAIFSTMQHFGERGCFWINLFLIFKVENYLPFSLLRSIWAKQGRTDGQTNVWRPAKKIVLQLEKHRYSWW
jgi:hypothetical protein